jgi:hypothetical protein
MSNQFLDKDRILKGNDPHDIKKDDIQIIDKDWISSRFMVPDKDLEEIDRTNRFWSSANNKFTDTTMGGNIGINSRPQFTRYADIRIPGRRLSRNKVSVNHRTGNIGMGRYYSEAIDDNSQTVFLEFGIPRFNSLFDFFSKSVDYVDSVVANTGRNPIGYRMGQLVGGVVALAAFPLITLSIWFAKTAIGLLTGHGAFNYYYLEPTMHTYWGTVNTIVTQMATEMGILIPQLMDDGTVADKIGTPFKFDTDDLAAIKELLPGVIGDNNYIDVFAIATRAQTLANRQLLKDKELFDLKASTNDDYVGYVKDKYSLTEKNSPGSTTMDSFNAAVSFRKYLDKVVVGDGPFAESVADDAGNTSTTDGTSPKLTDEDRKKARFVKDAKTGQYPNTKQDDTKLKQFAAALDAGVREGGAYAIFKVDFTGSVSESFSNSTGDISTKGALKSLSQKSRDVKFSMAGGNVVGDAMGDALGYMKDFVMGGLDSLTFGASNVLQTLMGGGYIDIPKKWQDSSASFPQISYSMQLTSPYGNTISQLQNIYIPLAMLLAGTLPLATGRASYTSPYICSIFNKGIQNVKLGMITSLTITRGTSNLPFSNKWKALAIDVSFTVTDFSSVLAAPVNSSIFGVFGTPLEDDTGLANYIATLGSRDLLTSKYAVPKAKLRASRQIMGIEQALSPNSWGLRTGESLRGILGSVTAVQGLTGGQVN